jgi:hypothetical protein
MLRTLGLLAASAALALGVGVLSGPAAAAVIGPFSQPLQLSDAEADSALLQNAAYGRRCYRECRFGHHGRRHCVWTCYRPRRWW